jgi:hypothetical protein
MHICLIAHIFHPKCYRWQVENVAFWKIRISSIFDRWQLLKLLTSIATAQSYKHHIKRWKVDMLTLIETNSTTHIITSGLRERNLVICSGSSGLSVE